MVHVGTSGFSFEAWRGRGYPAELAPRDFLPYYHRVLGFGTVEIDVSYFTLMSSRACRGLLSKTDPSFTFVVKCHRSMTLNEWYGEERHLRESRNRRMFDRFAACYAPLAEAGRLVAFLAQFGPEFACTPANRDYLEEFRRRMDGTVGAQVPLAVEFRHRTWLDTEQRSRTFALLRDLHLEYVTVDAPTLPRLAPLVPQVTGRLAYLRLHGRNPQWFEAGHDRYNYLYADSELQRFVGIASALEKKAQSTYVFFNNCHEGQALRNALRMRQMLGQDAPELAPDGHLLGTAQQIQLPI